MSLYSRRRKTRGLERFSFTYADVAELLGLSLSTVRNKGLGPNLRALATALPSLNALLRARRAKALTDWEVARWVALTRDQSADPAKARARLKDWKGRFPAFDVYHCAEAGCKAAVLGSFGLCRAHGKPAVIIGEGLGFEMLVRGRYVPLDQLLSGLNEVRHLDGNPWNCHPSNLAAP